MAVWIVGVIGFGVGPTRTPEAMSGRLRWWMLAGAAYLVLALTLAIAMDNELESRVLTYAVKRFGQPADARA